MLNDEKEVHIKRAVFLPMYYTVISLMVMKSFKFDTIWRQSCLQIPLSLWAAWGIYSQPIRYRSLFPHNEARKQAIAGTDNHSILPLLLHPYNFQFVSSRSFSFCPSSRSGLTPRCCCCWAASTPSSSSRSPWDL